MGQQAMRRLRNGPGERRDPVFVVPFSMNLSIDQMSEMIEAGQQPGVPFQIGDDGAQRPQGIRIKARYVQNAATMQKNSLKLTDEGDANFVVGFVYDASVQAELNVYIGGCDRSTANSLRIDAARIVWGPFMLKPGMNQEWNSRVLNLYATANDFPGRRNLLTTADEYDVIITLAPLVSPHLSRDQHDSITQSGPDNFKGLINDSSRGAIKGPENGKGETGGFFAPVKPKDTQMFKKPGTSSVISSTKDDVDEWVVAEIDSTDNTDSKARGHRSTAAVAPLQGVKGSAITCEASFARITAMGKACGGSVRNERGDWVPTPILIKCEMQKVLFAGGLFAIQELYGLDRKAMTGSTAVGEGPKTSSSPPPSSSVASSGGGAGGGVNPSEPESGEEGEGEGELGLDADATECVICLTDPRTVGVYPCRHVSMCAGCAEALPAQGNKCPICRRAASLLLVVHSSESATASPP